MDATQQGVRRLTNLTTGGPVHVDVEDGRIRRIVPLQLDETDAPSWSISARGRSFTPPRKTTLSPWTVAHRSTIYAPNRILTPLKRVDWDPDGARNIDKRGESGYEPISWDEALDIVAAEIVRIKREFGPAGMLTTPGSHHLWGNVGYRFSAYNRFMNLVGFTYGEHNPDSWEGWQWGGAHMWGFAHRLGIPEQYDLLEDALKNTEMMVFWSSDPETTGGVYGSFESTSRRFWLKELGIKMYFIDPYHSPTSQLFADKWLAPRPGTDVALGLAIAHTWLAEGTYDKQYVAERTHGFDEWRDYVLGKSDNVPKTPEWAELESGVPARQIRALAREWGAKRTMLAAGGMGGWGGACRASSGNEWARMMIALAAMQGLGKPGSNIWSTTSGVPFDPDFFFPGYAEGGISGDTAGTAAGKKLAARMWPEGGTFSNPQHSPEGQTVPRLRIPEAMNHERLEWHGKGFCGSSIESQFREYQYPAAGYPHVRDVLPLRRLVHRHHDRDQPVRARLPRGQDPVRGQPVDLDGGRDAVRRHRPAGLHQLRALGHRRLGARLGLRHAQVRAGQPPADRAGAEVHRAARREQAGLRDLRRARRQARHRRPLHRGRPHRARLGQAHVPRERPAQARVLGGVRGQGLLPRPGEGRPRLHTGPALVRRGPQEGHAGLGPAAVGPGRRARPRHADGQDRVRQLEPQALLRVGRRRRRGAAGARPAVHRELGGPPHRRSSRREFPLQLISPHPRFSFHTMGDGKDAWAADIEDHRELKDDGWYYWLIRLNPEDAEARGIAEGDLVRAFNDRGSVILCARVTGKIRPGTVHSFESCADYTPTGEQGYSPDRAGCINILTSKRFITPTSPGQACNTCLIEVERLDA